MSGSKNRHDQSSSSNPVLLTPATANPGSRAPSRTASPHPAHDARSPSQGPSSPLVLLPGQIAEPQNVVSPSRDTEGRQVVGGPLNLPNFPFDGDRMLSRVDVIGVRHEIVNTIPRTNDRRMKPGNFFFDVTNKQDDKQYVIETVKHTENAEYKHNPDMRSLLAYPFDGIHAPAAPVRNDAEVRRFKQNRREHSTKHPHAMHPYTGGLPQNLAHANGNYSQKATTGTKWLAKDEAEKKRRKAKKQAYDQSWTGSYIGPDQPSTSTAVKGSKDLVRATESKDKSIVVITLD